MKNTNLMNKYMLERLNTANIVITSQCNSRCITCDYWKREPIHIELDKIVKIYKFLKENKTETIIITGGEPTLHPSFVDIIKMGKEYEFNIILSTNGSNIPKIFDQIKDYITSICVSFDGVNKEHYKKIRGINNYDNIFRIGDLIKSSGSKVEFWLGCLIQKNNYKDLYNIYNNAKQTLANGIYFIVPELKDFCFGREDSIDQNQRENFLLSINEINELENVIENIINDDVGHFMCQKKDTLYSFVDYFKYLIGLYELSSRDCFLPMNSITINEHGNIKPCFYIDYEMQFDFQKDSINNYKMLEFRKQFIEGDYYKQNVCKRCFQFKS